MSLKVARLFISLLIIGLAWWWASKIHSYFFGLTQADLVGMMVFTAVLLILVQKLPANTSNKWMFGSVLLFLVLLFGLYFGVSQLLLFSDLSWLVVYLFLSATVLCVSLSFRSRLLYLLPFAFLINVNLPHDFKEEQYKFFDRVESSIQTRAGHAQLVRWKEDFWLYYNDQLQYSTIDKHIYQEAYVQPAMHLLTGNDVLLIGGENGMIEDELSKFRGKISLSVHPIDMEFHDYSRSSEALRIQKFDGKNVISSQDVFEFLHQNEGRFDLIIVDVPDPVNLNFEQYYTVEFYELVREAMKDSGIMVSQTGDLYKNGVQVRQIWNSVEFASLEYLPLQCQIPTLGQWTWVIASKSQTASQLRRQLAEVSSSESRWWNQDAMNLMLSFGKDYFSKDIGKANYIVNPETSTAR